MEKTKLQYDMLKGVARKLMALRPESGFVRLWWPGGRSLIGTPHLSFMLTSNRCRSAMVERFGRMTGVRFMRGEAGFLTQTKSTGFDLWFIASQWFVAYLIHCGQLHVKSLQLDERSLDYGRDMGGDPQDVGAVDALTFLLGLEDDEPGLSVRQWNDLRLEKATVGYYGDTIEGLNWFLALRAKSNVIYLREPLPTLKDDAVPRVLSYPTIQQVTVYAPIWDTTSDLGQSVEWTRLLSHLKESCPNLKRLDVKWRSNNRTVTLMPGDGPQHA